MATTDLGVGPKPRAAERHVALLRAVGLLQPVGRSESGYRLYNEASADRLRFIKGFQRMGLRLGDIKEVLDVRDRGTCPSVTPRSWWNSDSWTCRPK